MNNVKTVVLLAAISGLLVAIGGAVGGPGGAVLFLGIALAMNFGSYWFSADIVLRSAHAQEIERAQDPALFEMIEGIARDAGMPMPRVYVMESPQPNAFATGRSPSHAAVAVTTGIRRLLTERELRGVLGHEMAHVKNRDILTSSIVATIASAISLIGFIGFWFGGRRGGAGSLLALIVAPIAATLIQLATDAGAGVDRAPLHREPAARRQREGPVLDAPPARGARRAAAQDELALGSAPLRR
jgi:heat shock protein HtpX